MDLNTVLDILKESAIYIAIVVPLYLLAQKGVREKYNCSDENVNKKED